MRAGLAAAALATLALAAPAAAQPSAGEVLRGAVATLNRGHGPEVRDYGFTLVHDDVRTPVYVERGDEEWMVHASEDSPMGSMMAMAVVWPSFATVGDPREELEGVDDARYVREEQVGGRRAHLVTSAFSDDPAAEGVDSVQLYVDAETSHVLRAHVAGTVPEDGGPFAQGDMRLTVDMLDHRATTEGVVVPRRLHLRMTMTLPEMDPAERDRLTMGVAALRAQMQGSDDPEAREMLAMMELFSTLLSGGELDLPMAVEDVVVNAGPPAWLDEM